MKTLLYILSLIIPIIVYSEQLPTKVLGEQYNDFESCVVWERENCISYICITSEARDCQDMCQKEAEKKCKVQFGQS